MTQKREEIGIVALIRTSMKVSVDNALPFGKGKRTVPTDDKRVSIPNEQKIFANCFL